MSHKRVGFNALLQQVNVKSLKSGDRSMRLTLEVDNPPDDLIAKIGELQRADDMVFVALMDKMPDCKGEE